jgi:hypothetical protein
MPKKAGCPPTRKGGGRTAVRMPLWSSAQCARTTTGLLIATLCVQPNGTSSRNVSTKLPPRIGHPGILLPGSVNVTSRRARPSPMGVHLVRIWSLCGLRWMDRTTLHLTDRWTFPSSTLSPSCPRGLGCPSLRLNCGRLSRRARHTLLLGRITLHGPSSNTGAAPLGLRP